MDKVQRVKQLRTEYSHLGLAVRCQVLEAALVAMLKEFGPSAGEHDSDISSHRIAQSARDALDDRNGQKQAA